MIRNIYCQACSGQIPTFGPEDIADGWQERRVTRPVKKPAEHFIVLNGQRIDLDTLVCNLCGAPMADGAIALLVTAWRTPKEPPAWEQEYSLYEKENRH